jgi:lysophospholipase L1-like esterase
VKDTLAYLRTKWWVFSTVLNHYYRFHNFWNNKWDYKACDSNQRHIIKKNEFNFGYNCNNQGYRGNDFEKEKKEGEFRIMCLGDSWTEGVGSSEGNSWPEQLNNKLSSNFNFINLGKAGSDPLFSINSFKRDFIDYNPDLIILSINNSDIYDLAVRGGVERFRDNDKVFFKTGPWWEIIYSFSHIFRKFIYVLGYDRSFNKNDEIYFISSEILAQEIKEFYQYCQSKGIDLVLVLVPDQYEMENITLVENDQATYYYNIYLLKMLEKLIQYNLNIPFFSLQECYVNKGMTPENANYFYWEFDYHHNDEGYKLYAECIYENLFKKE